MLEKSATLICFAENTIRDNEGDRLFVDSIAYTFYIIREYSERNSVLCNASHYLGNMTITKNPDVEERVLEDNALLVVKTSHGNLLKRICDWMKNGKVC